MTDQELFGLAAVHNTSLWPEELTPTASFENLARLEQLRMNLGFGDASWHPYWQRQQRLIVQPPSTFFGYWQKDSGSMLLLLLNGANDEQEVLIELPSAASGNVCKAFRGGSVGRLAHTHAGQPDRYDAGKIATRGLAYPMRLARLSVFLES